MNTKRIWSVLLTFLVLMTLAGNASAASISICEKTINIGNPWGYCVDGNPGAFGTFTYNSEGHYFNYTLEAHDLPEDVGYSLLYYKDTDPAHVLPSTKAVNVLDSGIASSNSLSLSGSMVLGYDIPDVDDINPRGKIWLIKTSEMIGGSLLWTGYGNGNMMSGYLFESDSNITSSPPNSMGGITYNYKESVIVTLSDLTQTYTGVSLTPIAVTDPANLTIVWTNTPQTNAGSYIVTATINDSNYEGSASGTFIINKANASISVTPYSVVYNGNQHTATGTATGVSGENLTTGLDLSATIHTSANTYIGDVWTFTGNANYNDTSGTVDNSIAKVTPEITWNNPNSIVYGTPLSDIQLNAFANAAGTFAYTPDTGVVLSAGDNQPLHVDFTPTDTANYSNTVNDALINVNNKTIFVQADVKSNAYGDVYPELTYISMPDLVGSDTFTGGLTREAGDDVGIYPILQGTLALSDNYQLIYFGADFNITPAPLTVTAEDKSKLYGEPLPEFTVNYNGFVNGEDSSVLSGVLTFSTTATPESNVGTYPVTPSGLTSNNYNITFIDGTLTINKATATLTLSNLSHVYDGMPKEAIVTTDPEGLTVVSVTYDGSLELPVNAGSYNVTATLDNANYTGSTTGVLVIEPRPIEVTAASISKYQDNPDPDFTYSVTSGNLIGNDSFNGSLSRVAGEDIGNYAITQGTLELSENYNLSYVEGILGIVSQPAPLPYLVRIVILPNTAQFNVGDTMNFVAYPKNQFDTPYYTFVTWSSSNASVGTISGHPVNIYYAMFTAIAPGTTTIKATSMGINGIATATVLVSVPEPTPTPVPTPSPTPVSSPTPTPVIIPAPTPAPTPTSSPVATPTPTPSPTPVVTPTPAPTVTPHQLPSNVKPWDRDNNGVIDKDEAIRAIRMYFSNVVSKTDAIAVVAAYFG